MNSQNKLFTTYCPVAFLKICLNFWSITDAVVNSFLCCIKPMFGGTKVLKTKEGTLNTKGGTELFQFNVNHAIA